MAIVNEGTRARFAGDGFLILRGLLDPERDLAPLRLEYESLLDTVADRLHSAGAVVSTHADMPFGQRFCALAREMGGTLQKYLDICLPQQGITVDTPVHCGPSIFGLLTNPRLLAAVEAFVGPEIYSNPTQHVRIKPPEDHLGQDGPIVGEMAQTVWHQDLATIMPEAVDSRILTVWIAVSEATRENGCLLVAPGNHKRGLVKHCHEPRSSYSRQAIPDRLVGDRRVVLEMDPGDVLFMDKLTMHASLPNLSEDIRWSVDLRYQPGGEPTGWPWFPGFVALSRSAPESVLANAAAWAARWHRTRECLAAAAPAPFQRWPEGDSTAP